MKKINFILILGIVFLCSFISISNYDSKFVEISSVSEKGYTYNVVYMNRGGSKNRIKSKYFASPTNSSVPQRFLNFSENKNMIMVSSAGYMDNYGVPVGLTIDNGKLVI